MGGKAVFTGIIEEKGKVLRTEPDKLHIRAQKVLEGTKVGDSIAVNGVCLTVTALDGSLFTADRKSTRLNSSHA